MKVLEGEVASSKVRSDSAFNLDVMGDVERLWAGMT